MRSALLRSLPDRPARPAPDAADPFGCMLLPRGDALLDRIAANFCLAVRPLFMVADPAADPLLIATLHGPRAGAMRLRCWDRSLRERDLTLDPGRRRDHDIIRTATILTELISGRWPEPVRPSRIGVLTDGTGVAIAPEDPCPVEPGWIDRRLADPRGLTALKRFSPDGGLAVLQVPRLGHATSH
jgi:hypothetical protein